MKLLLATLMFIALGNSIATSESFVKLSTATVNKSQLIQDLRQLGAEYVLDKGIFQSTKAPLRNGNWNISKTESVERKIAGAVTYYRYTVILKSKSSPTVVRATYTVSFRPSHGKTLVTGYSYKILSDKNRFITDQPQFVDSRWLANNTYVQEQFQKGYNFTVAKAIADGEIKNATYHAGKTFSIRDSGFSYPYFNYFLTTLVAKNGYTYRVRITVPDLEEVPEEEQGNYPITFVIYPNK